MLMTPAKSIANTDTF